MSLVESLGKVFTGMVYRPEGRSLQCQSPGVSGRTLVRRGSWSVRYLGGVSRLKVEVHQGEGPKCFTLETGNNGSG